AINGWGVFGVSATGPGVMGRSANQRGVVGQNSSPSYGALLADNAYPTGPALEIQQGTIKVDSAGVNSVTPVFIHQATGGATFSCIDNPILNGDPNAILIVTPRAYYNGSIIVSSNHPVGVYYDGAGSSCLAGHWQIHDLDGANMTANAQFDVMVI